ncbi:MAG: hypothetical protein QXS20_09655 [Candidatus Thorarchaeota archaeon]
MKDEGAATSKPRMTLGRRAGRVIIALLLFIAIPFALQAISILTGADLYRRIYEGLIVWNEHSGAIFLAGFFVTVLMIGAITYLIASALEPDESEW